MLSSVLSNLNSDYIVKEVLGRVEDGVKVNAVDINDMK